MNELQIFNSEEFGQVRTVEINGKPYFVANDVAKALGYVETAKAIRTHCKGVSEMDIPSKGGIQCMKIIPEGDIYRLIVRSKLPSAEKFEKWVFDEVIPSIRTNGGYIARELSHIIDTHLQVSLKPEKQSNKVSIRAFEKFQDLDSIRNRYVRQQKNPAYQKTSRGKQYCADLDDAPDDGGTMQFKRDYFSDREYSIYK